MVLPMTKPKPSAICLIRSAGMGDVLMALGAAKALKATFSLPVLLLTSPGFRQLAEACVHIDEVFTDHESLCAALARYPAQSVALGNLDPVSFAISPSHMIDAYLAHFHLQAGADLKQIELARDTDAEAQVDRLMQSWPESRAASARILIHPGRGDPNRTWPQSRWEELAGQLIAAGHQVVVIGHRAAIADRGIHELNAAGLIDATDCLSPLATVALMRRSLLLVSTDGGPIQLAGATEIGIVGLYSVVASGNRLPFRHGEMGWNARGIAPACAAYPCYQKMHDQVMMEPIGRAVQAGQLDLPTIFSEWCLMQERYRCMKQEISVAAVFDACRSVLDESFCSPGALAQIQQQGGTHSKEI